MPRNSEAPLWTIMIYLAGDNDLSSEMIRAINDIGAAGIPNRVGITIQFDSLSASTPPFRYILWPDTHFPLNGRSGPFPLVGGLKAKSVQAIPGAENSADPAVLADFIAWSVGQFGSSQYRMLILSGHGSGAVGDFLADQNASRGQPSSLTIPRLREALRIAHDVVVDEQSPLPEFKKVLQSDGERLIHVLGMDSCLMSTIEVAHEVRDYVAYLVGSEGFVPSAGWPYGQLVEKMRDRITKKRRLDPKSICEALVDDYIAFYGDYLPANVSVDIAACDLNANKLKALEAAVRLLCTALMGQDGLDDADVRNEIVLAHWRAQSYKLEQHTDLWDFCNELLKTTSNDGVKRACRKVKTAIGRIVIHQKSSGVDFQYSNGLSVYFPWRLSGLFSPQGRVSFPALAPYEELRFPEASQWGTFLRRYLRTTMRPTRQRGGRGLTVEEYAARAVQITAGLAGADGKLPESHKFVKGSIKFVPEANKFVPEANKFVPEANKFVPEANKFVPEANKFVPEANKFLVQMLGGIMPDNMKNGPQQVKVLIREPRNRRPQRARYGNRRRRRG